MAQFMRTSMGDLNPVPPELLIYELDHSEPLLSIDSMGQIWLKSGPRAEFDIDAVRGPILPVPPMPEVLFADVPVMIYTAFGFSIAPFSKANDKTGPERGRLKELCDWAREVFPRYVDDVYDDPFWELGDGAEAVRKGVHEMKQVSSALGLDFDQVVAENSTEYERRRVAHIIEHGEDMPR